ncbi:MAG: outer membrane protein [Candidatus Midichloriaceae bacterium]
MKKILLTTIAVAAFAQAASAGTEAGKMYMRGDLGYQMNKYLDIKLKGFAGDIGFGYALSDSVRTDVTLNFSRPQKTKKSDIDATMFAYLVTKEGTQKVEPAKTGSKFAKKIKFKEKNMGLMANAYYDFNNASDFTPYVMAGVGISRSSIKIKSSVDYTSDKDAAVTQNFLTQKSKNLTSFTYKVGVGVGYEMAKDIHLDLGYNLSGKTGKYKTAEVKNEAGNVIYKSGEKMANTCKSIHTLTAGVRFAF